MIQYIVYLQVFATMLSSTLLYFFPGLLSYKDFVIVTGVISTPFLIKEILMVRRVQRIIFLSIIFLVLIIVSYITTQIFYSNESEKYYSFLLVLIGQIVPSILSACIVAYSSKYRYKIKQLAPFFSLIFTFISFNAAFMPTSVTSGGYVLTENGLNYQSTSYLAAYATSLSLFYLLSYKRIHWFAPLNKSVIKILMTFTVFVNIISIFLSGGRGGFLLYIIHIMFFFFLYGKLEKMNARHLFNLLGGFFVFMFLILVIANFAQNSAIETNGFERILSTINSGDTNGRDDFYEQALDVFCDKPLFGHGLGSVFYEFGRYTHNCFTDILVEQGLIGFSIFLFLLFFIFKTGMYMIKKDITDSLWIFLFLNGFVMSLFSGYYLANVPFFWILTFMHASRNRAS